MLFLSTQANAQTIDFSFTASKEGHSQALDSIRIHNCVQDCDTVLVWPDTVLSMMYNAVSNPALAKGAFAVQPCFPNPVSESTTIRIFVPDRDRVSMVVTDAGGQSRLIRDMVLDYGYHNISFTPGRGNIFFFTACWRAQCSSIKVLHHQHAGTSGCSIRYAGETPPAVHMKDTVLSNPFKFYINDRLLFIGYTGGEESGMYDRPFESKAYRLSFDSNIPCPDVPSFEYDGQLYHTVQIYNQCWMKENLNAGVPINGWWLPSDNDTIEKYCYDNELANCDKYGGLYAWKEMMQYTTEEGTQGICPGGWHIPTDEEWILLEGVADSLYSITDTIWDIFWLSRGFDAGYNLKSTSGWSENGNGCDRFGFDGKPAGYRWHNGYFYQKDLYAYWWTSDEYSYRDAWYRIIYYYSKDIYRNGDLRKVSGMSVRCLKD